MRSFPGLVLAMSSPLAAVAVAGLLTCAEVATAQAQWWEVPSRREWRRPPAAPAASQKVDEPSLARPAQQPLMAIISLNDQRITIYDANGKILRSPVSSGSTGYETPVGLFTIIQKNRDHVSNIYEGAAMPFMQRITWSGIALHAGALPGYPASHGCVRLPHRFAENLFDMTEKGMRVVLVRNDMSPVDISHPALFAPAATAALVAKVTPPAAEGEPPMRLGANDVAATEADGGSYFDKLKRAAGEKAAAADAAAKAAGAAKMRANRLTAEAARDATFLKNAEFVKANLEAQLKQAETMLAAAKYPAQKTWAEQAATNAKKRLDDANARLASVMANPKIEAAELAKKEAVAAEETRKRLADEAKSAQRKLLPISVLVSRATKKLYVRQGLDPILEVPVVIRDADKPIGTTLFTALGYAKDGSQVRWNALSMYAKGTEPDAAKPTMVRRVALKTAEPTPTSAEEVKAVLDRIEIPKEARDLVSEVVAPGSSMIVTDHDMSKETGGGTDFIVVMPGEPAGGLTIRPKRPSYGSYDDDDDRPRRRRRYSPESWW